MRLLERIGLTIPSHRRSLWVHGDTPLQFDAARQLIQAIMSERPHVGLVLTSPRLSTVRFLRSTFANEQTLAAPCGVRPVLRRFLRKLQVRHVLLLDGGRSFPRHAIRLAVSQQIPISAVNVGGPAAVDGAVLAAARQHPELLRLCVFDESVARQFQETGIPPAYIHTTGCLDLDDARGALWPSSEAVRRLLHLPKETPVAAAVDVPGDEERLVFDAFAQARGSQPGLRLLLEPRRANQLARIRNEIEGRGWIAITRFHSEPVADRPWDVLISASPGDLIALLPISTAAVMGGTYGSAGSGSAVALAISAGAHALVGPRREFQDVPWRLLRASPLVHPVEPGELATALGECIQGSMARPKQARVRRPSASECTQAAIVATLPDSPQLPPVAQDWKVRTLRDRAGQSRVWRFVAPSFMKGRVDSWEDLSEQMGHPRSVLCLGNGPSSEDPRLADFAHDCLIRINWRWKHRGFLVNPQIVFVGDPVTVHKVDHAVFGLWNKSLEHGMLLRHLTRRGPVPMKYFTMERISPIVRDHTWPARPTNGALMIAAAAALHPERLIIGGIDLYLHPDGRYPGDLLGNNQYARTHSRDTDLAMIHSVLAQYRGELIILSDLLSSALNATREVLSGHR